MADETSERTPQTDQELIRDMDQRIDSQENPTSQRVGDWVLSTQDGTGNLVASPASGGVVVLAEKPPEGTDPDGEVVEPVITIDEHKTPRLKVKGGIQGIANASTTVYNAWNTGAGTADIEEPLGTWTWTANSVTIPEAGDYLINVFIPWAPNVTGARYMELRLNGTVVDQDKHMTGATADKNNVVNQVAGAQYEAYCKVTNMFRCAQGDVFSVAVWQDSTATLNCGGPNAGQAWAQISILKVADADIAQHEKGTL